MDYKFKIVIPSFNNEEWVEANVASIINQTYTNYEVLYINDASTDQTLDRVIDFVKNQSRWTVVSNEVNKRRGYNTSPFNQHIQDFIEDDNDVLIFVDGDDWLYDDNVLANLNQVYNSTDLWMTYGRMVCYPTGEEGNPQNTSYSKQVHDQNLFRKDYWRASHLRTFKWGLYKKIKLESMLYSKTGEYYFHAEDLATTFPCLEMCPVNKVGVLPFYSYVFNATPSNRKRGVAREVEAGMDLEVEIRNKIPYNKIDAIV